MNGRVDEGRRSKIGINQSNIHATRGVDDGDEAALFFFF